MRKTCRRCNRQIYLQTNGRFRRHMIGKDIACPGSWEFPSQQPKLAGGKTLGQELWDLIQTAQGYAFIADDMADWPDEKVIARARNALDWEREAVRILRSFLSKHAPQKRK